MARGDRRVEIFRDDRDRWKFLAISLKAQSAPGQSVLPCPGCNDPEGKLSQWMHQLKTAYTVYFDRRHQVIGHLFEGRFKSTVIEAEKFLLEVSRYLHLNPVRGMVLRQGTSARVPLEQLPGHAGLEKRKSFLDSEPIQGVFQIYTGRRSKAWEYRGWVDTKRGIRQSGKARLRCSGITLD